MYARRLSFRPPGHKGFGFGVQDLGKFRVSVHEKGFQKDFYEGALRIPYTGSIL